jgi:hypothetical protein
MDSGLLYLHCYHPPGTNTRQVARQQQHGTPSSSRRQKDMRHANTQRNVQKSETGMIGEFAHAALSASPCRSTRDGRDGGDTEATECKSPKQYILIGKAEQARFNAVSVVRLRYCNTQCILQSIGVAFRGFTQRCRLWGCSCEVLRLEVFSRPVLPWRCAMSVGAAKDILDSSAWVQQVVL